MTDKNGTLQERRATSFLRIPASAISSCPFKGPDIAIVPVRYALDRSRFDVDAQALKPLPKKGVWPELPALHTRGYTLRQLYDGFVYVFDETAGTLHEYTVSSLDATFSRITRANTQPRADAPLPRPYLSYPRTHTLRLGFSSRQWSQRLCEQMRVSPGNRARWMTTLDLSRYCETMAEPGTLPLHRIAEAVADIDAQIVAHDGRFDDSCMPTTKSTADEPLCSPAGADARWRGSVPDQNSALLIALDDPLAVLTDLGLQLAADQAALQTWQDEHGHKVQMAQVVTNLCASGDNSNHLPFMVRNDVVRTQQYLGERDACLEQQFMEESESMASSVRGDALVMPVALHSREMKAAFEARYCTPLTAEDHASWSQRAKWRREVDIEGARACISAHKPTGDRLERHLRDTQADIKAWAEHIGSDPSALFLDTTHPDSLLYLQSIMGELLVILAQDGQTHYWLLEQEDKATTLFGTLRYGFSPGLKDALDQEADRLLNGLGDYANLATRVGEFNAVLNHPKVAGSNWMKLLKDGARETLEAMSALVAGEGKSIAETLLTAWLPVDSLRVKSGPRGLTALIRSLMIGQVLAGSPHRLVINAELGSRLRAWKQQKQLLDKQIHDLRRDWQHPRAAKHDRRSLSRQLQKLDADLRRHYMQIPVLLDFENQQYTQLLHKEALAFLDSGEELEQWQARARSWVGRQLSHLAAGLTWGVILINFISTAFLYADLTRDGNFSESDLVKVGYGLAYTGNLLMGVYVAAPWAVVQAAQPMVFGSRSVSILQRSASYWAAQGNHVWADAVRGFRRGMIALGAMGVLGATLEMRELIQEIEKANTPEERILLRIKAFAVAVMGMVSLVQGTAGLSPKSSIARLALRPISLVVLFIAGALYLSTTLLLNHLKQDSVGLWLSRCCWSFSPEKRYPTTLQGVTEEQRRFTEIVLSPLILVKQTFHYENQPDFEFGEIPVKIQDGAWIHILLPKNLRGRSLEFNVISSERPLGILTVKQSIKPVIDHFLNNGNFKTSASFGSITTQQPEKSNELYFPPIPLPDEDVVWQTWIPLDTKADFIEFQIWYPEDIVKPGVEDVGYLYQIELMENGQTAADGLLPIELTIKAMIRPEIGAHRLEVPA
jgi:hypothetical protein